MHWKDSPLAKRSKELKGTSLGGTIEQMNRFAARQSYRAHEQVLSNPPSRQMLAEQAPALDDEQKKVIQRPRRPGLLDRAGDGVSRRAPTTKSGRT